uniref:Helix-turn-helix domain-containing protein n=1 Tax=Xenopus tropicalis TaxID=8364 RepID=A0A803JV49_XENTR
MVVVLDAAAYKAEAMRQLGDVSTYKILKFNPTDDFTQILSGLIFKAYTNGLINTKIRDYLIPTNVKIPVFHHLPKVHKAERPPIGRPMVSGIMSLNERLSEFIDILLQPLVLRLTSYVRDTKHILQILGNFEWQNGFSWGTIDVTSLYSCIPHDKGLQTISYHLDNYSSYDSVLKDFILDAILYLLTHNFFKFEGVFYLQRCGTLMGAKFAPTYANLYMGWWEESRIFGGEAPLLQHVVLYRRFVDDLLFVWRGTDFAFSQFVEFLNMNDLNLKFTSEYGKTWITFLDLELRCHGGFIETDVYRKPCAGNSLLRADSCHPGHLFKGIPLGQFCRLRRNCSTEASFVKQSCQLRDCFLSRGYTMKHLSPAFEGALNMDRQLLLHKSSGEMAGGVRGGPFIMEGKKDVPIFVTIYSRQFYKIKKIIQNLLPVLLNDPQLAPVVVDGCKFVSRRAPTLGNYLSPTVLKSAKAKATWLNIKGTYPCGARRCITCAYVKCSTTF